MIVELLELLLCPDTKMLLLHEGKNDDGIRAFFMEVWELYVKVTSCSW